MHYEIELKEAIRQVKDIERALNESSIVVVTNKRGIIQFANDKFCEISKYSLKDLIGRPQNIVNADYHGSEFFKEMWRIIKNGDIWKGIIKNKAKDGTTYWVNSTIVSFLDEHGEAYQYISVSHDITRLKEYEQAMKKMAFYDPLTMLPNRNSLNKWLHDQSIVKDELSVLYVDIDRFKSINDTFGHSSGDKLLKEVANRVRNCLNHNDFIVRHGGDEFVIFINRTVSEVEIEEVAQKVLEQFSFPFTVNGENFYITASIGICTYNSKKKYDHYEQLFDELIRKADIAMYHAKKQGGNTYCFNTDDQNDSLHRYYTMEQELKQALEKNEFSIVYQPLINLKNEQIVGVEALLRWNNPKLGTVSPVEFIPLLEELGAIISVGKWVLKSVCCQMNKWHAEGVLIERASINVSPIQFRDGNFVHELKMILEKTLLDSAYLELEITEVAILQVDKVEETLHDLQSLGVKISIDDFGTGYSSLSYLKNLSANTLKIDKSFIHDLDVDEEVIVNTIITMAQNLKFKVLAEGIESEEQLSYLQSQDCHEGQGYYWSKPVADSEIEQLYKAYR